MPRPRSSELDFPNCVASAWRSGCAQHFKGLLCAGQRIRCKGLLCLRPSRVQSDYLAIASSNSWVLIYVV
eukprot:s3086_g14.t1